MGPLHARRLASVRPDLAGAFLEVCQDFARQFPCSHLGVAQGHRTAAVQAAAFNAGRSRVDGTTRFSKHQSYPSLALDFSVLDDLWQYVADGEDPRYRWAGMQFERLGFRWGGNFQAVAPDWDHVECFDTVDRLLVDRSVERYREATSAAPFLTLTA